MQKLTTCPLIGKYRMQEASKGGRPSIIFTDEQVNEIERMAAYLSIAQIADYFGICETTFHNIKNRDDRVFKAYKKGTVSATIDIANSLIQKAREGDTPSQIFYLKTQGGWSEKQKFEIKEMDGDKLNIDFGDDGKEA